MSVKNKSEWLIEKEKADIKKKQDAEIKWFIFKYSLL